MKEDATTRPLHPDASYSSTTKTLTGRALLDVCNLSSHKPNLLCSDRLVLLQEWQAYDPGRFDSLVRTAIDPKSGCFPLHWAAGTGFDSAVSFLLETHQNLVSLKATVSATDDEKCDMVNQVAVAPSTGRTPLHYAARNGHVSTCRLLVETYQAQSNPSCHKGCVTPLQLAVWQNHLDTVQYLVEYNNNQHNNNHHNNNHHNNNHDDNNIVRQRNDFGCGLQHWIGLVPPHRWQSDDGRGVLPLARYLHAQGLVYDSSSLEDNDNPQSQGHTPLHKAAWGGNIALIAYYCQEHGVYDTFQDQAGNFAADLALMGGHPEAHEWLLRYGSRAKQASCETLGVSYTATTEEIHSRYKFLARQYHPDKSNQDETMFLQIKAAYEHLIHEGGIGSQRNPKLQELQMLTHGKDAVTTTTPQHEDSQGPEEQANNDDEKGDDMFVARMLAILSDYGDKGFPISSIVKRWNQIWPNQPFPPPQDWIIQVPSVVNHHSRCGDERTTTHLETVFRFKRVRLLKFLKWKCGHVVRFRKVHGVELAFQKKPEHSTNKESLAATAIQ